MSGAFVYSGSALAAIDDKGRLSVPSFLRKDLIASSEGRVLCLGTHEKWDCLVGFGLSRKAEMLAEINREEDIAIARGEAYDRDAAGARKFSSLQELNFDASGRFIMPPILQAVADMSEHVMFHGNGSTFCLWDPQTLLDTAADVPVNKKLVRFHLDEARKNGGKKK